MDTQQAWLRPPQLEVALLQAPSSPSQVGLVAPAVEVMVSQALPEPTQTGAAIESKRLTQQPLEQVLPPQQGAPSVPHNVQMEFLQIMLASLQVLLAQHGPPAAPHTLHIPEELSHTVPASLQAVPLLQQG